MASIIASSGFLPRMSVAEYLQYELTSEIRHELVDGYLYAMTGASLRHGEITANLVHALVSHLRGTPCRVYSNNVKLRVADDFFYPDVFVSCGPNTSGDQHYRIDPVIIFEILSPSTQRYDRGDKWLAYRTLTSLQTYVLIAQDKIRINAFHRTNDWRSEILESENAPIRLDAIGLAMPAVDVYR